MRSVSWPFTCLLLVAASTALGITAALGWLTPYALIWHADGWRQAPWTLWTAAFIHLQPAHGLAGALALGALGVLGMALGAGRRDALALLIAWPLGTLALVRWPQVAGVYGLSPLIHAAAAVLAVRALGRADTRWLGLLMAGGLLVKLALERGWAVPVAFNAGWGFNVVYAAHLTSAIVATAAAVLLHTWAWARGHGG
ncbi:MAG: hypothetical protein Q4G71_17160 [Pseudomonadota bacterium]|nr:hypothetical protein [Pseudomonadota bacterium]